MDFDIFSLQPHKYEGKLVVFGLKLPTNQVKTLIALNKRLQMEEGANDSLRTQEYMPFVRLYEAIFPEKNIDKVIKQTKKVVTSFPPVTFPWAGLEEAEKVIILWGEVNEGLRLLQERLLYAVNDLREGYFKQKYLSRKMSAEQKSSLQKWGWPYVEEYNPYVVIAKPKKQFNLANFELMWEHQKAICEELMVWVKSHPGDKGQTQTFKLGKK